MADVSTHARFFSNALQLLLSYEKTTRERITLVVVIVVFSNEGVEVEFSAVYFTHVRKISRRELSSVVYDDQPPSEKKMA